MATGGQQSPRDPEPKGWVVQKGMEAERERFPLANWVLAVLTEESGLAAISRTLSSLKARCSDDSPHLADEELRPQRESVRSYPGATQ